MHVGRFRPQRCSAASLLDRRLRNVPGMGGVAGHSSHFASGQHLTFSTFATRTDASPPKCGAPTSRRRASENWWGKAVTVSPDQIFQD